MTTDKATTKVEDAHDALQAFIESTETKLETLRERYKALAMDAKLSTDIRMEMGHKAHALREFNRKLRKLGS